MRGESQVVTLEDVWYGYPPTGLRQPVLESVNLTVGEGDFVGVIGPNGGGKTTLLKLILGLLRPQRGMVRVFGKPPAQVRAMIGYVPQLATLDTTMPLTVRDVVLMGRLNRAPWGMRYGATHHEAALTALRQTDLADLADRTLGELSGGQMQRVLIARALASDARLLLLDEPTANVDPHRERGLTDLLHKINERLPIVLVSHDVSFVTKHLKHVACLNRTMSVHAAHEITDAVIGRMYHEPVRMVRHDGACPLHDPGCSHGCDDAASHAGGEHEHPDD